LPFALNYSAAHQLFAGRFDVAEQLVDEADRITARPVTSDRGLLSVARGVAR
jgi:hypothetical protein